MLCLFFAAATLAAAAPAAHAQDPSTKVKKKAGSAFPEQPGGMFGKSKIDKAAPLYLTGDQLIYDTRGTRVTAKGNVEINYDGNILTADQVIYDQSANTLTAYGNVELKEKNGNVIRAERYTLTDDFRDGFVQTLSVVAKDDSRITAEQAERREGNVTEFTNGTFTACKSDGSMPPLWCVGARKIIHDQAAATISYQDAHFDFFGQPVFYMPYFQHPDPSVKRKSGFLAPFYGNSEELGYMTEVPYFFALADNYDFTFHPRYLSEQGVLWQGDWRHKLADGEYWIQLAGIDQDCSTLPGGCDKNNNQSRDGFRGSIKTAGKFSLASWWSAGWDITGETDDEFRRYYKLDSILLTDRVNNIYMMGLSDRSYLGANLYQFGGLLGADTPESESLVHPIIDHNYVFADPVFGGEMSWDTNILSFSRDDAGINQDDYQDMNRAVTEVRWRRRLTDAIGISYTPFAELRADIYQFNNYVNSITGELITDDFVARGLATAGGTVSYPWVANSSIGSHVIEPIGQLIARNGSVRQRGLPDEDAKSIVFDDTNLFETTKFSGYDRLETGVRANVGVQYTFQSNAGPYARVLAGQSYHLAGDNAYQDPGTEDPSDTTNPQYLFNPSSGLETDTSDYVLGVYLAPIDLFRIISQSRFDEANFDLQREDVTARFYYGPITSQVTYAYTAVVADDDSDTAQQDIVGSLGLRLTDRWTLSGTTRYDIDAGLRLTDVYSLSYLDECFMLSLSYIETFIDDPSRDIEPDRTIMLRFEMKHLGGFNYSSNLVEFMGGEDSTTTGLGTLIH